MKKIILSILVVAISFTIAQAQVVGAPSAERTPLVEQAGSYFFCGDRVMTKKQYGNFLSTRCTPAYEEFQRGYRCYQVGWGLIGAGLAVDLVGSIVWALAPEVTPDGKTSPLTIAGGTLVIAGGCAILAALPTVFIGYARMDNSVDIYNVSQRTASNTPAYWTIQGSQNGIGIAYNF